MLSFQKIECEIPAGLNPGDTFQVQANGVSVYVTVPENSSPNETIRVDVPPELKPLAPPPGTKECDVQIPKGLKEGDSFQIQINGAMTTVAVPQGASAGQNVHLFVPIPPPTPIVAPQIQIMEYRQGGTPIPFPDTRNSIKFKCPHCNNEAETKTILVMGHGYYAACCMVSCVIPLFLRKEINFHFLLLHAFCQCSLKKKKTVSSSLL